MLNLFTIISAFLTLALCAGAAVKVTRNPDTIVLQNSRLQITLTTAKGSHIPGSITHVTLDGISMLGKSTGAKYGIGPYMDYVGNKKQINLVPGAYANYSIFRGIDSINVGYGGIVLRQEMRVEDAGASGQLLEQYWFLRDGETGLHMFTRLAYTNPEVPVLAAFSALRTLFRPATPMWTHLSVNKDFDVPAPSPNPANPVAGSGTARQVQDATWDLSARTNDPYVEQVSSYFTKYTLSESWRDHNVHGLFADGTKTPNGKTFGAWTIMNTKETYFGGPTHSDLTVDGILYNYMLSNHYGSQVPNITSGFDRTFGPSICYWNSGEKGATLNALREDAVKYASLDYANSSVAFYDSIAKYVPGYLPSEARGSFEAKVVLPPLSENAVAVLTANGLDYQDNAQDIRAYQYWDDICHGAVSISRVRPGTYRLTIYADKVFGDYIEDNVVIEAGKLTTKNVTWMPENNGVELWRIGIPDKSSGEFKGGYERDPTHPLHPPAYRIYWAQKTSDFNLNFPDGVSYNVGEDDVSTAMNVAHWSTYGGLNDAVRPVPETGDVTVNEWTIKFNLSAHSLKKAQTATFTVQLAGAQSAAGNNHQLLRPSSFSNIPYNVAVNRHRLPTWIIPYYKSSSCIIRSAVQCYQIRNKWTFPASYLQADQPNIIVLRMPPHAIGIYVQYDALRLEVK